MANVGVTFDFAAESAKLRGEIDKVRKELSSINATAKGIKDGFKLVGGAIAGAFSVSAVTAFLSKVNGIADGLNDLSGQLGASASGLQSLQIAASLAGGSADAANTALTKMTATIGDAVAGNKQATEAFNRLGLSAKELSGLKADEAFRRIADATAAIPNTFERASAAQDVFGKGAKDIAGLLAEGGSAIDDVNSKLAEQGALISDLDVAKIGAMNDELQFQSTVVSNLGIKFLANLSPAIGVATDVLADMVGNIGGATEGGKAFGTIMVAAIKLIETGVYSLAAVFQTLRSVVAAVLSAISTGVGNLLAPLASISEALGLSIADPLRNASNAAKEFGTSLANVSADAAKGAAAAGQAALKAANDFLNAGAIFDQKAAEAEARAAEAAARAAANQGAGTGYRAPTTDPKAPKDKADPQFKFDENQSAFLTDPLLDTRYLLEQQVGAALLELRMQQSAQQISLADQTNKSILDSFLLNSDYMIAAEQAKNVTLGDLMGELVQMGIQQGGALGKFAKAYAIAQTIWSTGQAVMKTMSSVPYPLNIAAAAMVAAKGAMQLANIKKTNVGSGGSVAGVSGGGGSSVTQSVPTGTQAASTESQEKSAVTIVVQGNLIETGSTATWLAEILGDAVNNRDMVFINSSSRQAMELVNA